MAVAELSHKRRGSLAETRARTRPRSWRSQPLQQRRQPNPAAMSGKKLLDLALAAVALTLLWPLMALVALAIRLDSPGPALFRQSRVGRGGAPFIILKFRTMRVAGADGRAASGITAFRSQLGLIQVNGRHPDITRIGGLLRATSLDELPQLLNVLRGEMSLVGPRPHLAELDALFRPLLPHISRRYSATPGLTGLAQVNGRRGPTPDVVAMAARLGDDLAYINNQSLWLDLRILALTPLKLLAAAPLSRQTISTGRACPLPIWPRARYIGGRCRASGARTHGRRPSVKIPWFFGNARRPASWQRPTDSDGGLTL